MGRGQCNGLIQCTLWRTDAELSQGLSRFYLLANADIESGQRAGAGKADSRNSALHRGSGIHGQRECPLLHLRGGIGKARNVACPYDEEEATNNDDDQHD